MNDDAVHPLFQSVERQKDTYVLRSKVLRGVAGEVNIDSRRGVEIEFHPEHDRAGERHRRGEISVKPRPRRRHVNFQRRFCPKIKTRAGCIICQRAAGLCIAPDRCSVGHIVDHCCPLRDAAIRVLA